MTTAIWCVFNLLCNQACYVVRHTFSAAYTIGNVFYSTFKNVLSFSNFIFKLFFERLYIEADPLCYSGPIQKAISLSSVRHSLCKYVWTISESINQKLLSVRRTSSRAGLTLVDEMSTKCSKTSTGSQLKMTVRFETTFEGRGTVIDRGN